MEGTKNYLTELQNVVFERLKMYGVQDSMPDLHSSWMHVRFMLSLHLKKETGEGLVKGNKPITEFQYMKCVGYLDKILPG